MVSFAWYKVIDRTEAILDNYCPHKGGPLANGSFDDEGYIVCPWHKYQYDPKTGQSPYDDPPVKHYKVELREDGLYVSFPSRD